MTARDDLVRALEGWCGDCDIVDDCPACRATGQERVKAIDANRSLVLRALVESGPLTDDELRVLGGEDLHSPKRRWTRGLWRFPKGAE